MKVFSVIGISKSGKTTTIENIIKELTNRNYSVGSVKEIHYEKFKMDTEGTNTYRHKEAGSQLVTARGIYETDILFQRQLTIDEILSFYHQDFVVLEGVGDKNIPKIITAHTIEEIEERLDEDTFAISGRISNSREDYKGIPVINSKTQLDRLVDLIEEKAKDRLTKKEECKSVTLKIKGKEIAMVPFVENILINIVEGFTQELKGYDPEGDIEICIKR
ncbi:MAG: molybdopterin-guanine dinucleotide biosynthesis protein B [Tissierellia bacterium]|nr:molybdopterin-guanine dinucleotide biosynthesis protein B [Tissierellia bacterium]